MDRRGFLRTLIGGLAAVTAERVFPFRVYSFPTQVVEPNLDAITAATLAELRSDVLYDNFFVDSPWLARFRRSSSIVQTPFEYSRLGNIVAPTESEIAEYTNG